MTLMVPHASPCYWRPRPFRRRGSAPHTRNGQRSQHRALPRGEPWRHHEDWRWLVLRQLAP